MNAFYICCITDPFLDVAKMLDEKYGVKPVYWVGDIASASVSDKVKEDLNSAFPDILYQEYFDAWRGVFPERVENEYSESYFDIDFLRLFSAQELQAISMMDRVDYDRHSFIYMERERFYLILAKKWLCCLDTFKPDVVIAAVNPHRVFDYVLYILCKYRNIPFITFQYSMVPGRIFPLKYFDDNQVMKSLLDNSYKANLTKSITKEMIPDDILESFNKMSSDYSTARPAYMASHDINDVKNKNMFFLFRRFMRGHQLFGKRSMFKEGQRLTIYKNGRYSIEESRFSLWEWYKKRKKTFRYNKMLHDYYVSKTTKVDVGKKFIVFFLHYQPEATTSPNGDIFANQYLCIETLLKNTPKDILIYVKEHPNQFMSHMQGHTKRIKDFYDDLIKNPRVRLVPFEIDSFTLMTNAIAVSTVTGTVGWEAAVRKKPVIIFGLIWYERLKGVLRVTDDQTARGIYDCIMNYKYDEQNILAYLYTFSQHSILAYHYKGYNELVNYSREMSANNMAESLVSLLHLNKK